MPIDSPFRPTPTSDAERVAAIYANQTHWLLRNATGTAVTTDANRVFWTGHGLTAARTGSTGVLIADPDNRPGSATIDRGLGFLRDTDSGDVLIWSAGDDPELDLRFLSRGCTDSFRPRWMWRGLPATFPTTWNELADGVTIRVAVASDRDAIAAATTIPYVSPDQIQTTIDLAILPEDARRVWLLIARDHQPAGQEPVIGLAAVNITSHKGFPVAALFNLGVDPGWRRRGVGTALTRAACELAAGQGAIAIGLNATPDGERVYRALGFVDCGSGQTWHLTATRLRQLPTGPEVDWAERLGRGDLAGLAAPAPDLAMPNGETPLAFAARFGQAGPARWLIGHGVEPEIVPLWRLGMRDAARAAINDPRYRDARRPPQLTTPLHEAIHSGDEELARLLIEAGADLTIRDGVYRGTPLRWAHVLGRPEIGALIAEAGGTS